MVGLSLDPPPSAPRRRGRALRRIGVVVVLALTFGAGLWVGRASVRKGWLSREDAPGVVAVSSGVVKPAAAAATSTAAPRADAATPANATPAAATAPGAPAGATGPAVAGAPEPPGASAAAPGKPQLLSVALSGPLEDGIARALGNGDRRLASELTAVVNRLLVWDLRVSRDGRKGDRLEVLWIPPHPAAPGLPESGEPMIQALRYASSKLGKVIAAYRFQEEGARFAHYYRPDGTELEPRLVDAPVADYEQITSLLRDGRRHKGIDFKTPVGSPVHAPFDGVVERRNWNFAGNGNCLDIHDLASGRHAIFLHLDVLPKEMAVGRRVKKGEVVASSGNSGHSFAPHLHYQLEDASGTVLDPFDVQKTVARVIPAAQKAAFDAERARLDGALRGETGPQTARVGAP